DERVAERSELRDEQEVDERGGQEKSEAQALKRVAHALDFPAHGHLVAGRDVQAGDPTLEIGGRGSDVAAGDVHEHVNDTPDVEVAKFTLGLGAMKTGEIPEQHRLRLIDAGQRDVTQRGEIANVLLPILRADEVVIAVLLVNPERRVEVDA